MIRTAPVHITCRRSLRVLIVEDESRMRELLADVIPDMGYPALAVRSAEEARRAMEHDPHDVLLLDLHLPGQGGMGFFETVRKQWPATQVIILTGHGDFDAARAAIHLDVVDFIRKPAHLNEIEQALERARRRFEARSPLPSQDEGEQTVTLNAPLADIEKQAIMAALDRNNGNRTAAAAELGISRRTLHYRLKEYGDTSPEEP